VLKKAGDLINLAMVYNNLGKDYDSLDQFDQAEKWWRLSLNLKEKYTSNSPDTAWTHFNLGELLRHTGRIEESVGHLVSARRRARMLHDRVVEARAIYSLAAIALYNGRKAQAKQLVALAVRKASEAEDWHGDNSRVRWTQKIEKMVKKGAYV
jgi:tetratricopeptide (TPR) repeat protein